MMKKMFNSLLLLLLLLGVVYLFLQARSALQEVNEQVEKLSHPVQSMGTQMAQVLHPTPTVLPDPVTIIHEVRSLARLETVQYTVEKVVTAETNQGALGFLFGDRLLFVAHGVVIAGVDLAKIGPEDLQLRDGVLYVRLPPAEIFIATLDNQKSYVYNRDTGLLTKGQVHLETAARREAERLIRQAALEDGILDTAQRNAEAYLDRFFRSLGFPDVVFLTPTPEATPTPTATPSP